MTNLKKSCVDVGLLCCHFEEISQVFGGTALEGINLAFPTTLPGG